MTGYFKDFTTAYSAALLWASTDDNGEALDATFGIHDFQPLRAFWLKKIVLPSS